MTRPLCAALWLTACGASPFAPPEQKSSAARDTSPAVSDADFATFVGDTTRFALDVYGQVDAGSANLILSPVSITEALGMTYAGAGAETATQIATALDFTLPPATTQAAMDRLQLDLATDGNAATSSSRPFTLHDVNALWAQKGLGFEAPYLDTLATDYGGGVYVEDFADAPQAAEDTINQYVAQQTDGTIPELLPAGNITSATVFVLTDVIYFDAAWATPFDPSATAPATFTLDDGTAVQVPTMNTDSAGYGSGSDYQVAELPYDGDAVSMFAIEPTDTTPGALARFTASLDADKLATVIGSTTADAQLAMPRVEFSSAFDLTKALRALGMVDAFTGAADFTPMVGDAAIQISDVVHDGFITVDEGGTEASGATGVTGIGGGGGGPSVSMELDHPYLVVVADAATRSVLFLGRVTNPAQ
jgi:serpin B